MSATSIQDQGYTPPDFLQKLFRKPSTASSQNIYKPLSSISNFSTAHYFSSSPLIPLQEAKCSPTKLLRTHSLNEDQRISTKKFKIFYNTYMEGVFPEVQSSEIWQKFEKSLCNPFEYDKFIEHLREMKETQRQISTKTSIQFSDLTATQQKRKSISCDRPAERAPRNERSLRKVSKVQGEEKEKMKKSIGYIRSILRHGEKFIRAR